MGAEDQFATTDCIDELMVGFQHLYGGEVRLEVVGVGIRKHEVKELVSLTTTVAEAGAPHQINPIAGGHLQGFLTGFHHMEKGVEVGILDPN